MRVVVTSFADTLSSLVIIANPDRRYGARNLANRRMFIMAIITEPSIHM